MMKKILNHTIIIFLCAIASSCAKDIVDLTGNIQGIVKDYNYGHLISNCQVTLTPSGKSTITSSSGMFEFNELEPGDYTLSFSKAGYIDETTRVTIVSGQVSEVSVMLKAKAAFALSESVLDFGDLETTKVFYVYNNSDSNCSYTTTSLPSWLSLSKSAGTLSGGSQDVITATINRAGSEYGDFSQNITFTYSGKATGTTTLLVKYQKVELTAPSVSCSTNAENVTQNSFDIKGNIIATGGSQILSYGHCWNTTGNPTINDNKSDLGNRTENGSFKTTANNLSTNTTYYVRAYAKNAQGIAYSEQIIVRTQDIESNVWDGNISSSFAGGLGTKSSPYIIMTGGQLLLAKKYSNSYFELGANIDLNNHNWLPFDFSGTLNGAGYTISNLNITGRPDDKQGLFSSLSGNVINLTLSAVLIDASNNEKIGAIAGSTSGTISDCVVYLRRIVGDKRVGGITGELADNASLYGCKVYMSESGSVISGNSYIGGVCGYVDSNHAAVKITGCSSDINLNGTDNIGGIIGMFYTRYKACEITQCGFRGAISGEQYLGGIVGGSYGGEVLVISQSYANIRITAEKGYAGGIRGSSGDIHAEVTIISCYATGELNCLGTLSIGGLMGQRSQSGGSDSYKIYHSYSAVISSRGNEFDGFTTCGNCYDCATISSSAKATKNCKVRCTNIATYMKDCYSEYASHWNYNNTWTWKGNIDGNEVSVPCPRLSWE